MRVVLGAAGVVNQWMWSRVQSFAAAELNYQVHGHEGGEYCGGSDP